jgi:hypothetical protein
MGIPPGLQDAEKGVIVQVRRKVELDEERVAQRREDSRVSETSDE